MTTIQTESGSFIYELCASSLEVDQCSDVTPGTAYLVDKGKCRYSFDGAQISIINKTEEKRPKDEVLLFYRDSSILIEDK